MTKLQQLKTLDFVYRQSDEDILNRVSIFIKIIVLLVKKL